MCCSDCLLHLEKCNVAAEGLSVYIVLTYLEFTTHKCLDLNRSREQGDYYTVVFNIIIFLFNIYMCTHTYIYMCSHPRQPVFFISHVVRGKWHFPDQQTTLPDSNIWRESSVSISHRKTPGFTSAFNRSTLCSGSDMLHFFCIALHSLASSPLPSLGPFLWV